MLIAHEKRIFKLGCHQSVDQSETRQRCSLCVLFAPLLLSRTKKNSFLTPLKSNSCSFSQNLDDTNVVFDIID